MSIVTCDDNHATELEDALDVAMDELECLSEPDVAIDTPDVTIETPLAPPSPVAENAPAEAPPESGWSVCRGTQVCRCMDVCTCRMEHGYSVLQPPPCCIIDFVRSLDSEVWTGLVYKMAAAIMGCGVAVIANCWLAHSPVFADVLAMLCSLLGFMLAVEIPSNVFETRNRAHRRKAVCLIALSAMLLFGAAARATWNPDSEKLATIADSDVDLSQSCELGCCRGALWTLVGSICFSALAVRVGIQLGSIIPAATVRQGGQTAIWVTTVGVVAAALLMVTGLATLFTAMYGSLGNTAAMSSMCPYVFPLPMVLLVRIKLTHATAASDSLRTWSAFLPMFIYMISLAWPLCLYNNDILTPRQTALTMTSVVGVLGGARLGMFALDEISR